ncbi:MAG: hypothetical protein IJI14_19680 [Anaerolineaceae bacterium]|nr:hypothetical protein [Anaerolineaceae bacterium]
MKEKNNTSQNQTFHDADSHSTTKLQSRGIDHFTLFIPILIILLHSVYIFLTFLRVPLNSDHANQVLQAADILNGNVFLKGWNLTGVSFYLSEIPFYVLGTAAAGVDTYAYLIAASLMVICLSILGYRLSFRSIRISGTAKVMLYLSFTGFPTLIWLGYLRGHCAIFIYFFLLLLISENLINKEKPSVHLWILFGLLTACGCMSDMQLLIIAILPITFFSIFNLLQNHPQFSPQRTAWLAGIAGCGTGLGIIMDSLLMKLGNINKNSFLNTRKFVNMDALGEKAILFAKGILNVFRADTGTAKGNIQNIITVCAAVLIITTALYFLILTLFRFLRKGEGDSVSVIVSFSILIMCIICFFTDIYTAEDSARYISYLPFAAAILICRNMEQTCQKFRLPPCIIGFGTALLLFFIPPVFERVQTPQDRLAGFLFQNGLTDGYADFWNASHTTVASKGKVRVRAIRGQVPELGKPDYLEMQNWFCKTEWYQDNFHNFIVFDGSGYLHVSEDVAVALLGEPEQILETDEYRIYVFNRDLNGEIVIR